MSEQANYFKIGLFVIVATALLLVGAAMLGAGAFGKNEVLIETYFTESVNGMEVGTPVKHLGVTVGKIHRIGFLGQAYPALGRPELNVELGYVLVEMAMTPSFKPAGRTLEDWTAEAVVSGFRVRTAKEGLMGGIYIEILRVNPPPPVQELLFTPNNPFIPSVSSRIEQLASAAEDLAAELKRANIGKLIEVATTIATRLESDFEKLNLGGLGEDLQATLVEARSATTRINAMLDSGPLSEAINDLPDLTARGRHLVEGMNQVVDDPSLRKALEELPRTLASIREAAAETDRVLSETVTDEVVTDISDGAASTAEAAADLRRVAQRMDLLLKSQEQNIRLILEGLGRTLDRTGDLATETNQNPSRVLFGEPPPRVNPTETGGRR